MKRELYRELKETNRAIKKAKREYDRIHNKILRSPEYRKLDKECRKHRNIAWKLEEKLADMKNNEEITEAWIKLCELEEEVEKIKRERALARLKS